MFNKKIELNESKLKIVSDINADFLEDYILNERNQLNSYCKRNSYFFKSYTPVEVKEGPEIAKIMSKSGEIAKIGPMGAVAGTISELCLDQLIAKGSSYSLINNGGDIAFINKNKDKNIICGIYAGNSAISGKIAFKFKKSNKSYGVCTSSGTVGYSFSYGKADAVSIIANKASIADALATSIGNAVQGKKEETAIENGLEKAKEFKKHFIGGIIIVNNSIGTIGKIPELIAIEKGDLKEFSKDTIN